MRISDWSSDVCSSDLSLASHPRRPRRDRSRLGQAVKRGSRLSRAQARRSELHRSDLRNLFDDEDGKTYSLIWSRPRSEEHTSELQSLMRISYAVFCLKKKQSNNQIKLLPQHNQNPHNT